MSDTVKLIIEIDPNIIYAIRHNKGVTLKNQIDMCNAIKNGIPLDSVKAEIKAKEMAETNIERQFYNMALGDVIEIIDNIGKTESEDKE